MEGRNYHFEEYQTTAGATSKYKVLAVRITSPDQVLGNGIGSIHACLEEAGVSSSVGLYFYRFEKLLDHGFCKIGEVTSQEGVILRKKRGWLYSDSCSDTYKGKIIHEDVLNASDDNPMYFVFYEFDVRKSFPKIDEIQAFDNHRTHFGSTPRNNENANQFAELGIELTWHPSAFEEVLNLKFPSGTPYP